jgi:hypothetical protein
MMVRDPEIMVRELLEPGRQQAGHGAMVNMKLAREAADGAPTRDPRYRPAVDPRDLDHGLTHRAGSGDLAITKPTSLASNQHSCHQTQSSVPATQSVSITTTLPGAADAVRCVSP